MVRRKHYKIHIKQQHFPCVVVLLLFCRHHFAYEEIAKVHRMSNKKTTIPQEQVRRVLVVFLLACIVA